MSPDPYIHQLLDSDLPCAAKEPLHGSLNTILHARADQRGLELCPYPSRAILKDEVHELIITSEESAAPTKTVNKIAYLGYFTVRESGVLWVGDRISINDKCIGYLAGYDPTHFPNHMNVIILVKGTLFTGLEAKFNPGDSIEFTFVQGKKIWK
jgi:hypothetical protein